MPGAGANPAPGILAGNESIMRKLIYVPSPIPNDVPLACKDDPELWFSSDPDDVMNAKALCHTCPFIVDCQELGVNERHGVWGGIYRREGRVADGPRPTGRPPIQR
jgi:WhiB family transcriptional regulator, redox-sensing transcriptional regulator